MGKYGLSAAEIGRQIGANALEVNRLLKDQGFLYGKPGAYGLTPKGEEFGVQRDHDNGYGGAAYRDWPTTHFDPSIVDVLDTSPEQLAKARADVSAARQAQSAARKAAQAEAEAEFLASQAEKQKGEPQYELDPQKVLLVVAGAAVIAGAAIGVRKGAEWYRHRKAARAESGTGSGMSNGADNE